MDWFALFCMVLVVIDAYLFTQGYDTYLHEHKTPAEKHLQKRKIMNQNLNPNLVNPAYVQISKKEAATILGMSVRTFDSVRASDPDCPKGFKDQELRTAPVKFRLSDIYTYSQVRMDRAVKATA